MTEDRRVFVVEALLHQPAPPGYTAASGPRWTPLGFLGERTAPRVSAVPTDRELELVWLVHARRFVEDEAKRAAHVLMSGTRTWYARSPQGWGYAAQHCRFVARPISSKERGILELAEVV